MGAPKWSDAELAALRELIPRRTREELVVAHQAWSIANGLRPRSWEAIEKRLTLQGLRVTDYRVRSNVSETAWRLGLKSATVRNWINKRWLQVSGERGTRRGTIITAAALRKLASDRPQLFAGLNRDRLADVLEDAQLADWVLSVHRRRRSARRPVECIDTGERFLSIAEAARRKFVTKASLSANLAGRTASCLGTRWRYLDVCS